MTVDDHFFFSNDLWFLLAWISYIVHNWIDVGSPESRMIFGISQNGFFFSLLLFICSYMRWNVREQTIWNNETCEKKKYFMKLSKWFEQFDEPICRDESSCPRIFRSRQYIIKMCVKKKKSLACYLILLKLMHIINIICYLCVD